MAGFRDPIKEHADKFWFRPCEDKIVYTKDVAVQVEQRKAEEVRKRKLTAGEWTVAILRYQNGDDEPEGVYLIKAADPSAAKAKNFDHEQFPERIMLISWYDDPSKERNNPEITAQKPANHGLNDCAHFVTECLFAGGIDVRTPSVPQLKTKLQNGLADTKTLAETVAVPRAERIIQAGIMQQGDVILYSASATEHHHSVVFLGNEQVAMHTFSNHPDERSSHGNWKDSTDDENHSRVTLIHFGRDDKLAVSAGMLAGWWEAKPQSGPSKFYFFESNGKVSATKKAPANVNRPIAFKEEKGYWFDDLVNAKLRICWTKTGILEEFDLRPTIELSGRRHDGTTSESLTLRTMKS